MYYFLSFFPFIGFGYFIVWSIAYYIRKQNKLGESELSLLISNRLFLFSFLFMYLFSIFENWYIVGDSYFYEIFSFYNRALGVWFFVFILYLFLPVFLVFKPLAKNIVISLVFGILFLYQDVSAIFPHLDFVGMSLVHHFFEYDYLPFTIEYNTVFTFQILRDSLVFILVWFIFFRFLKKRIPQKELSISDHLIEK